MIDGSERVLDGERLLHAGLWMVKAGDNRGPVTGQGTATVRDETDKEGQSRCGLAVQRVSQLDRKGNQSRTRTTHGGERRDVEMLRC
jgi:hypothetical protein